MKKTLTVIALLAGAVSGYSQGEVVFNLYSGTLHEFIYNTQTIQNSTYAVTYAGKTVNEEIGNSTAGLQKPTGSTVYSGAGLSGTGYSVELLAGPAATGASGLSPVSSVFGFHTGAANSGLMSGTQTLTFPTESYFAAGQTASIAVAAWDNEGGTVTTLAAAVLAGDPWGISPVVQFGPLVANPTPSPALPTTLEGFSLGVTTPEPSTIALGVMGASALLFRRRK